MGDAAQGPEGLHASPGEALRRAEGPGQGQLQHQVGSAPDGGGGPGPLVHQGEVSPLDEIPAHDADDGGTGPQAAAGFLQQVDVSIVEGIVLCYDTSDGHKIPP
jgi:hypothetical protein